MIKNCLKFLVLLPLLAFYTGEKSYSQDVPYELMTEFIREPENVLILDLKPEFSWVVPEKTLAQASYQILVSSSKEKSESLVGDVWNSQKIISSRSVEVEYDGDTLAIDTTYYWRVRVWDNLNRDSKYSSIQSFTIGSASGYSTTQNSFLINYDKPEEVIKISGSQYFIDFGKDAFGTLRLEYSPVKEETIIIHLGEKTNGLNHIDKNPGGSIRYQKILLSVTPGKTSYTIDLPADKKNTGPAAIHLPDSIGVVMPFRYCELENFNQPLTSENISRKTVNYYFDDQASYFTSSDTILNQIWDLCKNTIKATSFAGIYIDGDRERIPYEADAFINQLGHYYTDREYSLARKTNEYFINHPTWPTEWILHTVPLFYYDFLFTGNSESSKENYTALKFKTLSSLSGDDVLISTKNLSDKIMKNIGFSNPSDRLKDIVDWPAEQIDADGHIVVKGERDDYDMRDINTVVNAFYYRNLTMMTELAGWLGKADEQSYYKLKAIEVKKTFNNKFYSKKEGAYRDGEKSKHFSLHANMLALDFGLVESQNKQNVIDFVKSKGMACSVYGAQYLLESMYNAGESEYAYKLLTATNDRSWWNMIKSGSTMAMEAWDMKYKPNSDWNHSWGAAPANIIPRFIWGITPDQPGYSRTLIKPCLGNLTFCKIKVPTIRGTITADYKCNDNIKVFIITIPANMECSFVLPIPKGSSLYYNGEEMKWYTGAIKLNSIENKIIIQQAAAK